METILITWTSGFIGFHLAKRLLEEGNTKIIWFDSENDYYDVNLKIARRKQLLEFENFKFYKWNLANLEDLTKVFSENKIDKVCNLAAQAWVRYSLENPAAYIQSNIVWFANLIELAKNNNIKNFVYASSSSVYWKNEKQPFSVDDRVDNPISLYAASKKSNELIAHTYSHLFKLPTTWLRFFTVYGPYGRPDMAMFIFAKNITEWKSIPVFNHGKMKRDFTYIDDIVDGIIKSLDTISEYEVFNLWNHNTVELEYMIGLIEKWIWKTAIKDYKWMQPWDVAATWADVDHTYKKLWWKAKTSIEQWVENFVEWYKKFYS